MKLSTSYQGIVAALVLPLLTISDLKAEAPVSLTKIGALSGLSGAEITAYDPGTQRLFITSGGGLNIVDFSDPSTPVFESMITPVTDGATDNAITSVAVYGGTVAVAVPGSDEQLPGSVFFYDATTGAFIDSVVVGALPDMLTFTPDGQAILVANEGEADSDDIPFAGGFKIQISEIWSGQDGADLTADWFEITNRGDAAWVQGVDSDLYYDDESSDPGEADPIVGLVQLDPGESAIVVVGDMTDATNFYNAWDPDKDLDSTEIGYTDGAGLGGGDAVTIWLGMPTIATPIEDKEYYPELTSGVSWDVDLVEESTNGNDSGAVTTTATAGVSGTEPAVGSPGESSDGLEDPRGSVSYIDVSGGFNNPPVTEIGFEAFDETEDTLRAAGVRIFPFRFASMDFEPEYIAVTPDGATAFVSLQENNAIAKIDLGTMMVTDILPLGLKDYSLPGNEIDANDQDGSLVLANQPVFGMYMPDGIATMSVGGQNYFLTANEGDARDEDARIENLILDPTVFPDAGTLQTDAQIGRLEVSTVDGDIDGDGDFDQLFSYGGRSFSIRDANGNLVFDSGTTTETAANTAGIYPDSRADAKGTEPEGVTVGVIGGRTFAFVGLERADAITVFDVSNPAAATFQDIASDIPMDDAPEGLVFIPASSSPTGESLLVVSNEGDDELPALAIYRVDVAAEPTLSNNSAAIAILKKKISKLKKKFKNAKRKQQAAKTKKFKRQIKKLKRNLKAL